MDHNKGKPINTSVPSIAIRFNANAEEIEELYQSEEEPAEKPSNEKTRSTNVGDSESSPLRSYLPRLGKRSTSIDASLTTQDSSPPSDPWKFFAEIRGKITRSVEDTLTEIKHRNQEGDSLSKKIKAFKENKENSSLSDSEDISESSISKTCGIVSTTEGVEMSSDDETPSLEKDKKFDDVSKPRTSTLSEPKHKYKVIRKKKPYKEGNISIRSLANLYEINTGLKACTSDDRVLSSQENIEVESGIEALEDANFQSTEIPLRANGTDSNLAPPPDPDSKITQTDEEIVSNVAEEIDNLDVNESNEITVKQISGSDVRRAHFDDDKTRTYFAPEGFVDVRSYEQELSWLDLFHRHLLALIAALMFYFSISIPIYISGFMAGSIFTLAAMGIYNKLFSLNTAATGLVDAFPAANNLHAILEIPAVKEYQPVTKFEGWMNEYPDLYNPQTYHISQTQSVYIRLQGNLLRISHTRAKIPKRALWNEPKHKFAFTQHRIYNLLGAKIGLLPEGLNKRRHWSKKYPICITLNKDQLNFHYSSTTQDSLELEEDKKSLSTESILSEDRKRTGFLRKKKTTIQLWQMSLLSYLLVHYSIILILVIHWTACIHYIVPNIVLSLSEDRNNNSWIMQSKITELPSLFKRYVRCLFRACCYLLNVNHGIYEPITQEDVIVGIITFIIGNIFSALLFVLILQIVSSVLSAETKYQEIINQVKEYMGYKQLPLPMQRRLISYYEYRFQKSYFREDAITATLSVRLRREINVYCYRRLVDSVSIFKDMPQHVVVDIVNSLKAEIFLPNDIIVKAGTIGECMYFLASGTVCVVTPTGKEPQIFSKLTEEEDYDLESGSSRPSTPSPPEDASPDISEDVKANENGDEEYVDELLKDVFEEDLPEEDIVSLEDWSTFTPERTCSCEKDQERLQRSIEYGNEIDDIGNDEESLVKEDNEDSPTETHVYLFGRTDREKEDWFRRFLTATHKGAQLDSSSNNSGDLDVKESVSETLINAEKNEAEYLKYMAKFQKVLPHVLFRRRFLSHLYLPYYVPISKVKEKKTLAEEVEESSNVLWVNALLGRVLFDCTRDEVFTNRVKERIQRKLSSIKLPYFIEQLSISELCLGGSPLLIHKASKPVLDQRGLWVDLDITYEGTTVLTLQTKLNLMKLKQPPTSDTTLDDSSIAKWQNSDVDDTAESSTDDDSRFVPSTGKILDDTGNPVVGLGGTSNTSKKFIKMVDKIAESKFFQAATENRYIKKAMEGVSNTDLSLKVELKGLVGTLVLNIPPPPSDRVWIGFRPSPKLWLSAQPIVGERNISFLRYLTAWIEKKLSQEFQKVLVIPNMEDVMIPVMSPKLPE